MIILLCVIFTLMIVAGRRLEDSLKTEFEGAVMQVLGGLFLGICCFVGMCLFINYTHHITIDREIKLYEDENLKIEQQISEIVDDYMTYESETFENIKDESPIVLVSLYPELKSNELVEKQIDVYVKNNKEIKKLKKEKLDLELYAWWLFFGGRK